MLTSKSMCNKVILMILKQTVKKGQQADWSKWKSLSVPLLAGALAACHSSQPDGCYKIEVDGGLIGCFCTTDGVAVQGTLSGDSCVPAQPAPACSNTCANASVSGLLNPDLPSDSTLTSGDINVRLDLVGQSGDSLVAFIDVLDCGNLVGNSSIPSGGSKTFNSGGMAITVNVGAVSNGTPRSAQVQAEIACGE